MEKRLPYVDRFGVLHVPWLRGQAISTWDSQQFEASRKNAEFWRSVDRPRKDGKCFSAEAWLKAAVRRWTQLGGIYTGGVDNRYRIEPRVTDPHELAAHYWELQDSQCWEAKDAWELGWKSYQWAGNVFKRFGIQDGQVKQLVRRRAEEQWRVWAAEEAKIHPPIPATRYAPASA